MVALSKLTIPPFKSYSPAQWAELEGLSPAVSRYRQWQGLKPADIADQIRLDRHTAWLECVAATYFDTASTRAICWHWTKAAERLALLAWQSAELADEPAALFALGKWGAEELNLSSDIDLMVIAQPGAQSACERKLRQFRKLLNETTELGFALRVDFDLRPGGQSSSMVVSPSQFQDHYWARGEAWEKMALVRLRPLFGPNDLSEGILQQANRFSYRKFLDFNLLQDLQQVRSRIHTEGFEERAGEIHLKLTRGGIRDIEIFVNALQVLHGGKIQRLKTHSTEVAFEQIARLSILPAEDIDFLHHTYWAYRRWENLSQALGDRQTHSIFWPCPWGKMGWPERSEVEIQLARVDKIVSELLGTAESLQESQIPAEAEQPLWLRSLGFKEDSIQKVWPKLLQASELPHKTDRDERSRQRFLVRLIDDLAHTHFDKDLGLSLATDFLRAMRAKSAFFALLNREPKLLSDLAKLFSFSPYLGALFASRPELVDNFVLNVDEPFSVDFEQMLDEMAERKFIGDVMASIRFLGAPDTPAFLEALTLTADTITAHLLKRLTDEFQSQPMDILCLGKWGGRELGLKSDLDFIFLSAAAPGQTEHRVAKRFISRLTDPYRGGSLYEIDLRLRPSGKAGPILTTPEKLQEYLATTAEVWERQAYLRARPLHRLTFDIEALWNRPVTEPEIVKLKEIRQKLLKPLATGIDLKFAPGGVVDIEFAVQTASLLQRPPVLSPNTPEMLDHLGWPNTLLINYDRLRELQILLELASSMKGLRFEASSEAVERVALRLQTSASALVDETKSLLETNETLLKTLDPRQS